MLDSLDGGYWQSADPLSSRCDRRDTPPISLKALPDQKIITRLSNLISMSQRMKCSRNDCSGMLIYVGYMPNAYSLRTKCSICAFEEKISTARTFALKHGNKEREVYDIPYLEAIATRFIPGGGASTQSRFGAIMGLPSLGSTTLHEFYRVSLLHALRVVHKKSITDNLELVRSNALNLNPSADGVSIFYPIAVRVDARWDKPWGWNALNSTIRMVESTTDLVIATVTLHRKESSPNKYLKSAKSCDADGSAMCLKEVTKLGFDVVRVIHDDDASSMCKLTAAKVELASSAEYLGKITPGVTESLCTRYD